MDAPAALATISLALRDELAANNRTLAVDTRTRPARFHNLKAMGQSPQHARASFGDGRFDSLALRLGAGLHAKLFGLPAIEWTGKVRNGKVWDAFKAEHADKVILNRKEWARSDEMAEAIREHRLASRLLFGPSTVREQTIMWDQRGRSRRSTPDVRGPHHVTELKTTRCAEPTRFQRDATFRCYHAQLADQAAAIAYETGRPVREAYIVAIESVKPYPITVFQLTERALEKGAALCSSWLDRLISCETTDIWPPYSTQVEAFDVPDLDFEMAFEEPEDPDWAKGAGLGGDA